MNDFIKKASTRLDLYKSILSNLELVEDLACSFNSSEYRNEEAIKKLSKDILINKTPIIYRFYLDEINVANQIKEAFSEFHEYNKNKTRGAGRFNTSKFNNTNGTTLYVGSKMKNFRSRFKQHLGMGAKRTFGMKLKEWDNGIQYVLRLETFKIDFKNEPVDRNVIELIEQELWNHYQPIFGKKSGL